MAGQKCDDSGFVYLNPLEGLFVNQTFFKVGVECLGKAISQNLEGFKCRGDDKGGEGGHAKDPAVERTAINKEERIVVVAERESVTVYNVHMDFIKAMLSLFNCLVYQGLGDCREVIK